MGKVWSARYLCRREVEGYSHSTNQNLQNGLNVLGMQSDRRMKVRNEDLTAEAHSLVFKAQACYMRKLKQMPCSCVNVDWQQKLTFENCVVHGTVPLLAVVVDAKAHLAASSHDRNQDAKVNYTIGYKDTKAGCICYSVCASTVSAFLRSHIYFVEC